MSLSLQTLLLIVPPLVLIEGVYSGSEIALVSADRIKLQEEAKRGSRRAAMALELATHPERILSSTLLMTSLCVIGTSSLIDLYFISRQVAHAEVWAVAITSPIIVLLGELLPKALYQRHATRVAPWVAPAVQGVFWAFYPITRMLSSYTTRLTRILGPIEEMISGKNRTTREELRSLLSYGRRETEIKTSEKRIIRRIFDFRDAEARDALIPLIKIYAIEEGATYGEALGRFRDNRHSRMPVYSGRVDNIVGVLELKDLAAATISSADAAIRPFITPAHYVPETQSLKEVLNLMRAEEAELAVVVDEYGGAVGILTFEDIVEEIVGEIEDEYDDELTQYKELGAAKWNVQARMSISQIRESLRLDLPEGDYETLGGFLLQQFGRIPEVGDELYFDTAQGTLKFIVRKADGRRIDSVSIELIHRPAAPESN